MKRLLLFLMLAVQTQAATLVDLYVTNATATNLVGPLTGAGTVYTPDTTNLVMWFKGDILSAGNAISLWTNAASSSWDLVQGTAGNQPVATNDGTRTFALFPGSDDGLTNAWVWDFSETPPITVVAWVVAREPVHDANHFLFADSASNLRFYYDYNSYDHWTLRASSGWDTGVKGVENQWYIYCAVFNGASSLLVTNNVLVATGDVGAASDTPSFILGNRGEFTQSWGGGIAEFLLYTNSIMTNLPALTNSANWGYLTNKYPGIAP